METEAIVNWGMFGLISVLLGLVSWLTKDKIKNITNSLSKGNKQFSNYDRRIDRMEGDQWEIKGRMQELSLLPKQCNERTEAHRREHHLLDTRLERLEEKQDETLSRVSRIQDNVSTFKDLLAKCVDIKNERD